MLAVLLPEGCECDRRQRPFAETLDFAKAISYPGAVDQIE
jgi:hypothetical protein